MNSFLILFLIKNFLKCTETVSTQKSLQEAQSDTKPISFVLSEIIRLLDEEIKVTLRTSKEYQFNQLEQIMKIIYFNNTIKPKLNKSIESEKYEEYVSNIIEILKQLLVCPPCSFDLGSRQAQNQIAYNLLFYYEVLNFYFQRHYNGENIELYKQFLMCYNSPFDNKINCLAFFEERYPYGLNTYFNHLELMVVPETKNKEVGIINHLIRKIVETYQLLELELSVKEVIEDFNQRLVNTFIWALLDNLKNKECKELVLPETFPDDFKNMSKNLLEYKKRETLVVDFYQEEKSNFECLKNEVEQTHNSEFLITFYMDSLLPWYRDEINTNRFSSLFDDFRTQLNKFISSEQNKSEESISHEEISTELLNETADVFEEEEDVQPLVSLNPTSKVENKKANISERNPMLVSSSIRKEIFFGLFCFVTVLVLFLVVVFFYTNFRKTKKKTKCRRIV